MRGDAYTVYYYCAKDGCRHSLAVFGVLGRAHDDVVAAGEHAADGAEDYDGEDGDDDAVGCWISGGSRALYIFPAIFLHVASFSIFLSGSSVPCPCVEGGNDGLHCGRGAAVTELVLVLVVSALSGAVWVFARVSTAAISVEGYWSSIDAKDGLV